MGPSLGCDVSRRLCSAVKAAEQPSTWRRASAAEVLAGAGGGRRGPGKLVLAASEVDESLTEGLTEAHQPPCRISSGRLLQHSLARVAQTGTRGFRLASSILFHHFSEALALAKFHCFSARRTPVVLGSARSPSLLPKMRRRPPASVLLAWLVVAGAAAASTAPPAGDGSAAAAAAAHLLELEAPLWPAPLSYTHDCSGAALDLRGAQLSVKVVEGDAAAAERVLADSFEAGRAAWACGGAAASKGARFALFCVLPPASMSMPRDACECAHAAGRPGPTLLAFPALSKPLPAGPAVRITVLNASCTSPACSSAANDESYRRAAAWQCARTVACCSGCLSRACLVTGAHRASCRQSARTAAELAQASQLQRLPQHPPPPAPKILC